MVTSRFIHGKTRTNKESAFRTFRTVLMATQCINLRHSKVNLKRHVIFKTILNNTLDINKNFQRNLQLESGKERLFGINSIIMVMKSQRCNSKTALFFLKCFAQTIHSAKQT